ncbi:MAG: OsmC family peroxiredoxin [bacterium]
MTKHKANAYWEGNLQEGQGIMNPKSMPCEGEFSANSRFEGANGTNPEELIGAAHAGCFSMSLSHALSEAGYTPEKISTEATVTLSKTDQGFEISDIELTSTGYVAEIGEEEFIKFANEAKENCPVSKALAGTKISVNAKLEKTFYNA